MVTVWGGGRCAASDPTDHGDAHHTGERGHVQLAGRRAQSAGARRAERGYAEVARSGQHIEQSLFVHSFHKLNVLQLQIKTFGVLFTESSVV